MSRTLKILFSICVMGIFKTNCHDLEFTMKRHHEDLDVEGACGEISCQYGREGVNVTRIRMSKMETVGGHGHTLAELTSDTPSVNSHFDQIEITGSLSPGKLGGKINIRLLSREDCKQGLFSCDVTYNDEDEQGKTDMAIMGPRLPAEDEGDHVIPDHFDDCNNYAHLEEDLREKTSRLEKNFDYKIDRVEQSCLNRNDFVAAKLTQVERTMGTKLTEIESRFDGKYTRLDQVNGDLSEQMRVVQKSVNEELATCSHQYTQIQNQLLDFNREEGESENAINKITTEVKDVLNLVESSKSNACERGMGNDVTKNYPSYVIMPGSDDKGPILCDTQTDGGGWIVIQRRVNGEVDFYRDWTEYREGFGSVEGEFWMGNERIHQLTSQKAYELRIDMRYLGKQAFAVYESFLMESESDLYMLRLGTYQGTAGNNLQPNQAFTTFDRDNDKWPGNCAVTFHGAWWYVGCHNANLNGQWGATANKGPRWEGFTGPNPVYFSEMKIRRVPRPTVG